MPREFDRHHPGVNVLRTVLALGLFAWSWLWIGLPAAGMLLGVQAAPTALAIYAPPVEDTDGRRTAGTAWREQVGAITHIHLAGSPQDIGTGIGLLAGPDITALEGDMMQVFTERVPYFPLRHLVLGLVNFNNRSLAAHYRPEELAEIAASTAAHGAVYDSFGALGPSYSRGIQYHALHDISQYLIDSPLVMPVQVGCTAVAVTGGRSADGHLIVGRMFDFEGGARFDLDKIVYTVKPDRGHAFVSVCWAGMTGCVTGLNDAGLWVSVNAAATDGAVFSGRPVVLMVRELLQHAATIPEALAIIERTPVFVSDGILIASRSEATAVVAEKGPHGLGVRRMTDDRLVLTNHFTTEAWASDAANAQRIARGTTTARWARAEELLAARPAHDPASIAAIMRDRRGAGGREVGFNNRATINAWIGCHLAVCDVTAGIVWVSEPRHGLGVMRAFTVDGPVAVPPLPADPELDRCLRDLPAFDTARRTAKALLAGGLTNDERPASEAAVAQMRLLNPDHFETHWLAALVATDPAERRRALQAALDAMPAYPADRERIAAALAAP